MNKNICLEYNNKKHVFFIEGKIWTKKTLQLTLEYYTLTKNYAYISIFTFSEHLNEAGQQFGMLKILFISLNAGRKCNHGSEL